VSFFLCCIALKLKAAEHDTVFTTKGDVLVGEIKSLNLGVLTLDANSGDSDYKVKWSNVEKLVSKGYFTVYYIGGEVVYCSMLHDDSTKNVLLIPVYEGDTITTKYNKIYQFGELEEKFLDRLDVGIKFGYSFTKASNSSQLSLRNSVKYNEEKWDVSAQMNAFINTIDSTTTSRGDAALQYQLVIKHNWFAATQINWFNSDEQEIELRTTGGIGIGNYLVANNTVEAYIAGGIAFNNERFTQESSEAILSYEGLVAVGFNLFGWDDFSVNTTGTGFPSITDVGRYRVTGNFVLVWDLPHDFDLTLGYTLNYDNKPPNNGETADYVVSLTFGWSL